MRRAMPIRFLIVMSVALCSGAGCRGSEPSASSKAPFTRRIAPVLGEAGDHLAAPLGDLDGFELSLRRPEGATTSIQGQLDAFDGAGRRLSSQPSYGCCREPAQPTCTSAFVPATGIRFCELFVHDARSLHRITFTPDGAAPVAVYETGDPLGDTRKTYLVPKGWSAGESGD